MFIDGRDFVVDGHRYKTVEEIPDLGSLVGVAKGENGGRSYNGLYSDRDKLPHYKDLETGSDALLVDSSDGLHYLYYEKSSDTWYEC